MKTRLPISVFIITKDEEDRITKSVSSVIDWVGEVIVIDSGSDDDTVNIARSLGAKTFLNEWKGYGPQKIYGESLCKNDWLLNIDADEEISPKLRDEIIELFKNGEPEIKAFRLLIKVMSRFGKKPSRFSPAHFPIRLYNKNYAGFKDSTVHDSVVLKIGDKIGNLKGVVFHRSFRSYSHAIAKINRYSSMQAEDMVARGRIPSTLRIIFEPFTGFLKGYFIKRYVFLGLDGFIEGVIYSFARTLRLIKARELINEQKNTGKHIS